MTVATEASIKGEWQRPDPGAAADDNFGHSVSSAGDYDSDGFEDLIVGIIFDDTLALAAGRAEILFGGSVPGGRAPLSLQGDPAAHDQFGVSVTGGGDLNGDGRDDVAVGARFNDRGATDAGAVFVFFGGPGADGQADLVIPGNLTDDWFAQSVAIVPDIDGDGDDELLVGAPYNDDVGNAAGRALVYRGGTEMDVTADIICYGDPQSHAHFGWSLSAAGDVDGDGYGDWIVGARLWGVGPDRARGRAYIFLGGPGADGVADHLYTGERIDDWFGQVVAGLGDASGDGFDDVGVGAIHWDRIEGADVVSAVGRVYVYPGGAPWSRQPIATVDGTDMDDQMGFSIAGPLPNPWGGRAGWLSGAHFADSVNAAAAGEVRISALAPSGAVRTLLVSHGDAADDQWGHAVAAIQEHLGPDPLMTYAAASVFNDEAGPGSGKVERAVARCVELTFPSPVEIQWTACAPFAFVGLLQGQLSSGVAAMSCVTKQTGPPFFVGTDPAPGEAFMYLVVGEDNAGRDAAAGYDSDGGLRNTVSCP